MCQWPPARFQRFNLLAPLRPFSFLLDPRYKAKVSCVLLKKATISSPNNKSVLNPSECLFYSLMASVRQWCTSSEHRADDIWKISAGCIPGKMHHLFRRSSHKRARTIIISRDFETMLEGDIPYCYHSPFQLLGYFPMQIKSNFTLHRTWKIFGTAEDVDGREFRIVFRMRKRESIPSPTELPQLSHKMRT